MVKIHSFLPLVSVQFLKAFDMGILFDAGILELLCSQKGRRRRWGNGKENMQRETSHNMTLRRIMTDDNSNNKNQSE